MTTPGGLLVATLKYNEISIEEGYVEADVDEDGKVSEQDLVAFCQYLQLSCDEESVRAYFKDLDPQGKGFIEFDAWVKALTEAGNTEASRRLVIVSNVVNRMQTAKVRTAFDMWCDYTNDSKWGFETTTLSMFAAIDTDNSGTISVQKLHTFMQRENVSVTEKEVRDRFDQMDSQKRGSVSQDEFLEAAKKDGFKVTALFAAIDTDNSGKISIEKLRTFMQRKDSLVSEKTLQECFDQMDSKKMGSVSKEEFVEATIDCLVDSPKQHKSKEKLSSSSSDKSKGKVSSTLAASVKSLEKSQLQDLLEKYDLEDDADVLTKNGIKKQSDLSYVNESVIKAMQLSPVSAAKLRKLVQDHGARALSPAKTPAGTVVREMSCQRVPLLFDYAQSAEEAPLLLSGGGSLADVEAGELEEALDANDRIVDELKDAIIKLRSNLEACGGSQYSNAVADVQAVSVKASQAAKESREKFENTVLKVSEERVASMRMLKTLEKKLASHLAARSAVSAAEDSELSRRIKETLSRNSHLLVCNCEQVPQDVEVSKKAEDEASEPPLLHTDVAKLSHTNVANSKFASDLMPPQKIIDQPPRYPRFKYRKLPLNYYYEGRHDAILPQDQQQPPDESWMHEYIYCTADVLLHRKLRTPVTPSHSRCSIFRRTSITDTPSPFTPDESWMCEYIYCTAGVLHAEVLGAHVTSVDDGDVAKDQGLCQRVHGATTALHAMAGGCVENLSDAVDQAEHLPTKVTGVLC